jgi:HK97 family phage major capsid protein
MTNPNEELRKALSTSTTALIPEVVSAGIRRFIETKSPLYNAIRKLTWPTNSYLFREVNALPTASFAADGAALPSATTGTYAKRTTAMKYIYTRGEVTGPMIAASGNVLDALQYEIELHASALVREIENTIINGDDSSGDDFDGLIVQIATHVKAAGSVAMTLALVDETLDLPAEYPTHIVGSRAMGRRFNALLQAQQRFVDRIEVAGGFKVPSYNGLPILCVDTDIDDAFATTILFPDMNHTVMPVNKPLFYEPLAKTKDSEDFMLGMYCTLACEGTARYHAKMTGVTF